MPLRLSPGGRMLANGVVKPNISGEVHTDSRSGAVSMYRKRILPSTQESDG